MKKYLFLLLFVSSFFASQGQVIFVRTGLSWGVLDSTGKIIRQTQFEKWEPLYKPVLAYSVMKSGKWGVLNLNGKLIIETEFERIFANDRFDKKYYTVIKGATASPYNANEFIGGKQGIFDLNGKNIIPVTYDIVGYSGDGFFSVGIDVPNVTTSSYSSGGKWGLLDSTGKIVIPLLYRYCNYYEGNISYAKDGQKDPAYSNLEGKVFDAKDYTSVFSLTNSLFIAEKERKFGLINFDEKIIVPCEYDEIGKRAVADMIPVNQGARRPIPYNSQYDVRLDGLWGICKTNGEVVLPLKYEQVDIINSKLIAVKQNGKWGVVDTTAKIIIPIEYDLFSIPVHGFFMGRKNGAIKWYIFNEDGKKLLPNAFDTYYEENIDTKHGTFVVKVDGQCRVLKQDGKLSEPMPDFNLGSTLESDTLFGGVLFENQSLKSHTYFVNRDLKTLVCEIFIRDDNGALVKQNGKWGYINPDGSWLIPPVYDTILPFSEKFTFASNAGNWFILNDIGNVVQDLGNKICHAQSFSGGLAPVSIGGTRDVFGSWQGEKWGYINSKGETVVEFKFDKAKGFKNGIAAVRVKSQNDSHGIINSLQWILINKEGKQVTEAYFDEVSY